MKYVDILVVIETKLDETFLNSNFRVEGFSDPFRLDRNSNGGIMIYVKVASRLLTKHTFPGDIEGLFVELNFRNYKLLICGTYHPPSQSDHYYFNQLDIALDKYSNYENIVMIGDFHSEIYDVEMSSFLIPYYPA